MEAPQAASSGRRQGGFAAAIWVAPLAIAVVAIAVASLHLVQEVRLEAGTELPYSIEPPAPGDPDESTRAQKIGEIIEKRVREYGLHECCVAPAPIHLENETVIPSHTVGASGSLAPSATSGPLVATTTSVPSSLRALLA